MTLLWVLASFAILLAVAACWGVRRVSRKLDQLTQAYWELRYQHGQLRAQINRLDPERQREELEAAGSRPPEAFVPLSSLKR